MKFTELEIPGDILFSLKKMGFSEMTPIQEATYPHICQGRDICALAETGSGKTAACAIPLIQKIDPSVPGVQGLIIVPTRELCIQYVEEITKIAKNTDVISFGMYGGLDRQFNIRMLRSPVHILVATPGRLKDLIYEGVIDFPHVKCAILDEADELLNAGFIEDVEFLLSCIRQEHQTLLFSATMPEDIKRLAEKWLKDPEHISLITDRASPESIEHTFLYTSPRRKKSDLIDFLKAEKIGQVIIFSNARHLVERLYKELKQELKRVECIHGGMSQDRRTSIFRRFKQNRIRYMIATDVAGRGLDFSHVTHIVNWDFPMDIDSYIHRTGRVGRMGRKGKAFTLVLKRDLPRLKRMLHRKKVAPVWISQDPLQNQDNMEKPRTYRKKKRRPYSRRKNKEIKQSTKDA